MVTFTFKAKTYQITPEADTSGVPMHRAAEDLLRDFEYCFSVSDYMTAENRLTGGLKWGWIVELNKPIETDGFW